MLIDPSWISYFITNISLHLVLAAYDRKIEQTGYKLNNLKKKPYHTRAGGHLVCLISSGHIKENRGFL